MEAKELRRTAWDNLADNWWLSIGVAFVASLLGGLITAGGGSISVKFDDPAIRDLPQIFMTYLKIVGSLASILAFANFIIGGVVELGYAQYLLKQYNKANFEFRDLFSQFHRFGQGFAQAFLRGLYIFLWSLLFIIPGIIKTFSYAMTPFIMAENPEMTAGEAITASKEMMDGHKFDLFILGLSFIGWALLEILTLGIASLFVNPYRNAAQAAFYKSLTAETRTYE